MLVVIWHSSIAIKYFNNNYWISEDVKHRSEHYFAIFNHLGFGVQLFFVVSGFIMGYIIRRKQEGHWTFLAKRYFRILPMYWLCTLIVVLVFYIHPSYNLGQLDGPLSANLRRIVTSFLLVPDPQGTILGVGWTLVHEFIFYYTCFLVMIFGQRERLVPIFFFVSAASIILALFHGSILYGNVLSMYNIYFLCGLMIEALWMRSISWRLDLGKYSYVMLLLGIGVYCAASIRADRYNAGDADDVVSFLLYAVSASALVLGFLFLNAHNIITISLLFIGDISYSLYLTHWFTISVIGKIGALFPDISYILVILWHTTAVLAAIGVGYLFFHFFEEPVTKYLHRAFLDRKRI